MTMEEAVSIVKPHNDKIAAEARVKSLEREVLMLRSALSVLSDEIGTWEMDGPRGSTTVAEFIQWLTKGQPADADR